MVWDVPRVGPQKHASLPDLPPERLLHLWTELIKNDAARAYRAMGELIAAKNSVTFLDKTMQPVAPVEPRRLDALIADLDSDQFVIRHKAHKELERLDQLAEPALLKARATANLERNRRIERLLARFQTPVGEPLRSLRAVEILETIGDTGARQVLARLAQGDPAGRQTQEARIALDRFDKKSSRQGAR